MHAAVLDDFGPLVGQVVPAVEAGLLLEDIGQRGVLGLELEQLGSGLAGLGHERIDAVADERDAFVELGEALPLGAVLKRLQEEEDVDFAVGLDAQLVAQVHDEGLVHR